MVVLHQQLLPWLHSFLIFFFFPWIAHENKGEKLFEEHNQNTSCKITMLLRNGQTFQHSFILFCQYYFIQARSAALKIVMWRMWKNSLKNFPGQCICVDKSVWGGLILFFSTSVDIACLQQLIWEKIFSFKEGIETRQVLLYWQRSQHLYSISVQLEMFVPDLTPTCSDGKSSEKGEVPSGDSRNTKLVESTSRRWQMEVVINLR